MWPNPQFPVDLITFTKEILNGKHNYSCSGSNKNMASNPNEIKDTESLRNFELKIKNFLTENIN